MDSSTPRRALFLDLDHTVIRPKSGGTFPEWVEDWEFVPGMFRKLSKEARLDPRPFVLVTNQAGVQAGHQTRAEVEERIAQVRAELETLPGLELYCYVAYALDEYHKPRPGLALRAAAELGLCLGTSCMVGDLETDRQFASLSGIGSFVWTADFLQNVHDPHSSRYGLLPRFSYDFPRHRILAPMKDLSTLIPDADRAPAPTPQAGLLPTFESFSAARAQPASEDTSNLGLYPSLNMIAKGSKAKHQATFELIQALPDTLDSVKRLSGDSKWCNIVIVSGGRTIKLSLSTDSRQAIAAVQAAKDADPAAMSWLAKYIKRSPDSYAKN